jgi:hypothetical protein
MDAKFVVDVIAQVGFPIVLILGSVYFLGKYGVPKVVTMIEGINTGFRDEMKLERDAHSRAIERLFDVHNQDRIELKSCITDARDDVMDAIKENCKKAATG